MNRMNKNIPSIKSIIELIFNFISGIAFGPVSLSVPLADNYEVHVTKIDADGNPLWVRRIGGGQGAAGLFEIF